MKQFALAVGGGIAIALVSGSAHAAFLEQGIYQLHNHPDGSSNPPAYGMRIDGLDGTNAIFTLDFDHPDSDMVLVYTGNQIVISGVSYGGRDTGASYANDAYLGLYEVEFVYTVGVGLVPGDDDAYVNAASGSNFGSMKLPSGTVIDLADKEGNPAEGTFRFGDEDNDNGHRGFDGISGWGWFMSDDLAMTGQYRDFLFTAEYIGIPAPATALVLGPVGALVGRRRR
jgi:hypothetical protein